MDTMEDAKAINGYLNKVHEAVSEVYIKQNIDGIREQPERLQSTTLSEDARKGDKRAKVHSADICWIVPIRAGSSRWHCGETDEEFLREEEGRLRPYRKGSYEDIHFICYVDLLESNTPET